MLRSIRAPPLMWSASWRGRASASGSSGKARCSPSSPRPRDAEAPRSPGEKRGARLRPKSLEVAVAVRPVLDARLPVLRLAGLDVGAAGAGAGRALALRSEVLALARLAAGQIVARLVAA